MTIEECTDVSELGAKPMATAPGSTVQCSLADLTPGRRGTVLQVDPGGCEATARRLGDLGFTPGTVVDVVRRAPLRDPVVYRVKDYEICLRRAQASSIRVSAVR